ncbi:hypothetical protein NDU88_008973 [Pleurodeles waltl]|uniref:Uncharacterized protein n=1 Tax=Pleurodeles waltl TaxID=8319 RepID=A0AAV7NZB7_PLEWA|nr:hypothetical protein NDU88_008973 [Pleurodeles waltl]
MSRCLACRTCGIQATRNNALLRASCLYLCGQELLCLTCFQATRDDALLCVSCLHVQEQRAPVPDLFPGYQERRASARVLFTRAVTLKTGTAHSCARFVSFSVLQ